MSPVPSDQTAPPAPAAAPVPAPPPATTGTSAGADPRPLDRPPRSPVRLLLLVATAALLVGWFSWLGYTALAKSHSPVVSRGQAAAATVPVRAKLTAGNKDLRATLARRESASTLRGEDDKPAFLATVVEQLTPTGPAKDARIGVRNLPDCSGYAGEGEYLLLLAPDADATIDGRPAYVLVGLQRSPGADFADGGPPVIYPWTEQTGDDLREQVKRLFP
jgi:hypothetical protein